MRHTAAGMIIAILAAHAAHAATLYLEPTAESVYVKPSDTVVVDLNVAGLTQPVLALQAMLNFSSSYFLAGPTDVSVGAGGGVWTEVIYRQWTTGGDLDVALGVQLG